MGLAKELIKEVPGANTIRSLGPNIWSIVAAETSKAQARQAIADDSGVLHIVIDDCLTLTPPLGRQCGRPTILHDVGGTIEKRALPAVPKGIQLPGGSVLRNEGFGHYRPT